MKWVLHAPGWGANPAFAHEGAYSDRNTKLDGGEVSWRCFFFKELRLSSSAALLILQGMPVKDVFPPHANLIEEVGPANMVIHTGPFILLKGSFHATSSPVCLRDVALAVILDVQGEGVEEQLLGALLTEVLTVS